MKLCQNVNHHKSRSSSKLGHVRSKTRSLGEILEKHCEHSKRHSFDPKFMKLCQIVNHHNVWVRFEIGSCWVKNWVTRSDLRKTLCTL